MLSIQNHLLKILLSSAGRTRMCQVQMGTVWADERQPGTMCLHTLPRCFRWLPTLIASALGPQPQHQGPVSSSCLHVLNLPKCPSCSGVGVELSPCNWRARQIEGLQGFGGRRRPPSSSQPVRMSTCACLSYHFPQSSCRRRMANRNKMNKERILKGGCPEYGRFFLVYFLL